MRSLSEFPSWEEEKHLIHLGEIGLQPCYPLLAISFQLDYIVDEEIQREQHANSERVCLVGGRATFDVSWGDKSPTLLSNKYSKNLAAGILFNFSQPIR